MDPVVAAVNGMIATWKQEAEQRKARTPGDQAAITLESCASELEAVVVRVADETTLVPLARWARERGAAASSVRRWCLSGQIPGAVQDAQGDWKIPRNAKRELRHRRRVSA